MTAWLFVSFRIDMYSEGIADLYEMVMLLPLCPPDQKGAKVDFIKEKIKTRYFPAFEKVCEAVQHVRKLFPLLYRPVRRKIEKHAWAFGDIDLGV